MPPKIAVVLSANITLSPRLTTGVVASHDPSSSTKTMIPYSVEIEENASISKRLSIPSVPSTQKDDEYFIIFF